MSENKITIKASISAPIDKVWNYWVLPEHITRWNFATSTWQCPRASNDLRVGGKYSARMEAKDGSFGFDFCATYDEVELHKKISYTMEDGRQATTSFATQQGTTTVTTTFDAEGTNPVEMQRQGWQAILDNFKSYAEANKA